MHDQVRTGGDGSAVGVPSGKHGSAHIAVDNEVSTHWNSDLRSSDSSCRVQTKPGWHFRPANRSSYVQQQRSDHSPACVIHSLAHVLLRLCQSSPNCLLYGMFTSISVAITALDLVAVTALDLHLIRSAKARLRTWVGMPFPTGSPCTRISCTKNLLEVGSGMSSSSVCSSSGSSSSSSSSSLSS